MHFWSFENLFALNVETASSILEILIQTFDCAQTLRLNLQVLGTKIQFVELLSIFFCKAISEFLIGNTWQFFSNLREEDKLNKFKESKLLFWIQKVPAQSTNFDDKLGYCQFMAANSERVMT